MNNELRISSMLKDLGIGPNFKGYEYLKEAVSLGMLDRQSIYSITKNIYPEIAKKFKINWGRVDRSIRYAIEIGWSRGNTETQDKLFGYAFDKNRGKPTNSEFIGAIVDYILMTQED